MWKKHHFWRQGKYIAVAQIPPGIAAICTGKSREAGTEKRPKGELNHHNKGAEDEERVQLPSLRRRTTVSVAWTKKEATDRYIKG